MKLKILAKNFHFLEIDEVAFWFSYETCVAFRANRVTHVVQNQWSNTTAKHLATIDGGQNKNRLEWDTFQELLDRVRLTLVKTDVKC